MMENLSQGCYSGASTFLQTSPRRWIGMRNPRNYPDLASFASAWARQYGKTGSVSGVGAPPPPTQSRREKEIVRRIKKALLALPHCHCVKIHGNPFSHVGTPDILGCHEGRMFALEVKRPGGVVSDIQARELENWKKSGALVGVVMSPDDALKIIAAS